MDGKYFAVIGKNFGDEGKGFTVDFLCKNPGHNLVVRANGGAQAGHTVVNNGRRFVFHELSSGSFCKADTFWADTFHPDLFKLRTEWEDFKALSGEKVKIYASGRCGITTIDDILINMALEVSRGSNRHGSCGMGIYECELREAAGYKVSLEEVVTMGPDLLYERLKEIRGKYVPTRLKEIDLSADALNEYAEMLNSDNVLYNFAEEVCKNIELIEVVKDMNLFLEQYDRVVFENGQGLLLDSECVRYLPNVTGSRTGLTNISEFMNRFAKGELINVFYVTRTYVTRHGAGELPCECTRESLGNLKFDETNVDNPWQGTIRYGRHESVEEFFRYTEADMAAFGGIVKKNIIFTHTNETDNKVIFADSEISVEEFAHIPASYGYSFYVSDSENDVPKKCGV